MSAITFSGITYSGTPDSDDAVAAKVAVAQENVFQLSLNPAFTPLAISPAATLKASYLTVILNRITRLHQEMIKIAKLSSTLDQYFQRSDIDQIIVNLVNRAAGGESAASIITDTAS